MWSGFVFTGIAAPDHPSDSLRRVSIETLFSAYPIAGEGLEGQPGVPALFEAPEENKALRRVLMGATA